MIVSVKTGTILDQIVERKMIRQMAKRREMPLEKLAAQVLSSIDVGMLPLVADFTSSLGQAKNLAIIAEIKRASPSRGLLSSDFRPADQASAYEAAGVKAISVLTEEAFFSGSAQDFCAVRRYVSLPLLQKDFIVEPGQIYEARMLGASAVLLIAALFDENELAGYLRLAGRIGLSAIVEVHDLPQLMRALSAGAAIIGINNRDLRTFHVDLATTEHLAGLIPAGRVIVAESGISTPRDLARVYRAGAHAALIGESLMKSGASAESVRLKIRELASELPHAGEDGDGNADSH